MIRLQCRAGLAAVGTGPVPELKKPDPLDGRVRSRRPQFARVSTSITSLADIAVFASVLRKIGGKSFLVAFVVGPHLCGVLSGMSLPPTPHRFPGFLWIAFHPFPAVLTSTFRVLMWHGRDLAAKATRGNRTNKKARPWRPRCCCGGTIRTSDLRVMSPTSYRCSTPRTNSTSYRGPKKNANHRAIRDGLSLTVRANASLACPSRCTAMIDSFGAMYP
jgi:hypothetical protein